MREQRFFLAMDQYDRGILLRALNELRNKQISEGRPKEPVDDLIVKVAEAPSRKFRVIEREGGRA